jgi:arabinofuranosyltransferase
MGNNSFTVSATTRILLILAALAIVIAQSAAIDVTWDDSFIFYRYAANLVSGHGLVFNPGEYVEGYSSILWTLLLSLGGVLGIDIPVVGRWLGILLSIGTLLLTFRICRKLIPTTVFVPLLAIFLLSVRFDFGLYAHSGMETPLMTFLVTLTFMLYMERLEKGGSLLPVGIAAGLVSLTRPEGLIVVMGFTLIELIRMKSRDFRALFIRLWPLIIPAAVFLLGVTVWRYSYYHDFFPNTFYAKISGLNAVLLARGFYHLMKFFVFGGGFAYLVPFLIFASIYSKNILVRTMFVLIFLFAAFTVYTTGDWFPFGRFMQPILPLLVIGTAAGIWIIVDRLHLKRGVTLLIIGCFLLSEYQNALRRNMYPAVEAFDHRDSVEHWSRLGRLFGEMRRQLPDLSIASYPIGAIGYYSGANVIDMIGLTDRHIARYGHQLRGYVGHERSDMKYVLERRPDILYTGLGKTDSLGRFVPAFRDFDRTFYNVLPYKESDIIATVLAEYDFIQLRGYSGFWCRKDSPCRLLCDSLMSRSAL